APAVTGVDNRFGGVNASTTVIESDLRVENPNPIGVDLGGVTVDYDVSMNGIGMATGGREGVSLPRGESALPLTSRMRNERIPAWWVSHVNGGERTTLTVDASVHSSTLGWTVGAPEVSREIRTDLIGGFDSNETRPVNANRPLVSDPVLYVNETSAAWGDANESATPIDMDFTVYNPKATPLALTEIGYTVTMNDVVVGEGATNRSYVVPGQRSRTLETTTRIDNPRLDEWWVSHLERDQTTDLRIEFYATLDVAGDSVRVPLDALTYTETFETDVFGTKAGNESVGGSADGGAGAATTS
ncbi:LEA type 2 family protein, partial [Halobium palmae]